MNQSSARNLLVLIIAILVLLRVSNYYLHRPYATQRDASKKSLIVGTNAEYQPFSFFDIHGNIIGFDIDIINEIAHRLGKQADIRDMSFEALIPQLQLGSVAVVAAGITPTKERAQNVNFLDAHLNGTENPLVIVSLKTSPITRFSQLFNKRIVVNQGYTADYYLSDFQGLSIIRLPSAAVAEGLLSLQSNRADAFVTAKLSIDPLLLDFSHLFSLYPIPNTGEKSALAVSKKYPELLQAIQNILKRMQKDGSLDAIKKKWKLK